MTRVVELFAGVGGFRIGFEGSPENPDRSRFGVIWSNQWEPSTKTQHAAEVYVQQWNLEQSDYDLEVYSNGSDDIFVNKDIGTIEASDIPDHDLLCGGFPCQDYSVARTSAKGLEGKKGVLWWEIFRILKEKRPGIVMLENVDRLLKSPTSQRGRDFAVMLASLSELNYVVEWRVINAADYGMPQRRRRVFILAYGPGTPQHEALSSPDIDVLKWMEKEGVHAKAFPIQPLGVLTAVPHPIKGTENADLADVSEEFNIGAKPTATSPFKETGVMIGNHYYTYRCKPRYDGEHTTLSDILLTPRKVPLEYCIEPESVLKEKGWKYLKGAKEEPRKGTDDFTYFYKEGPMIFPDALDKPSRTIITGEGGPTASRFKHVVKFRPTKKMRDKLNLDSDEVQRIRKEIGLNKSEWIRRLTPVELERLNMFPDNHTVGPTDAKRAFFMGNALVCGIVRRLADVLAPERENFFVDVAKQLLQLFNQTDWENKSQSEHIVLPIHESSTKGVFGIQLLGYTVNEKGVNYNGTQADPKKKKARKKQGLFDFLVITGDRDNRYRTPTGRPRKKATHKDLFEDLLDYSTEQNCLRVWSGENPLLVGNCDDEREALVTMFLMMLEQEINWGEMEWQKRTNFWPETNENSPEKCRPRDMLIGFIRQSFRIGKSRLDDNLKYWMFNYNRPPTTSDFTNYSEGSGSWAEYKKVNPEEASLFTDLSEKFDTTRVMDNGVEIAFSEEADKHPDNHYWTGG